MAPRRSLLAASALPRGASRPRFALAEKGFRPFFLLGAVFAAAIVPIWLLVLAGVLRPGTYLDATSWHAHEMVFGFAVAVIAGFLLTAVGNWTGRETATGAPLLALAALWVGGRVAMACANVLPRGMPALVDLSFLPVLIVVLARSLVAARDWRHFVMLAVLAAMFAANVVVHLDALGVAAIGAARRACLVAVDSVVLVILVIAGRVFPMFTRNATGAADVRSHPRLDLMAIIGMAALTVIDVLAPESATAALFSGAVGILAAARAAHWGARHSARHPLLWILHAGYAWVAFGLVLRAVAAAWPGVLPASLATHALTVGAIGSLTLGMMARVALGHTGRLLVASKTIVWAFMAITVAAVARVFLPLLVPGAYLAALVIAGALWTTAFSLYVVVYAPILIGPRADGAPG
jgi:uncharacterized protein involved in response to NO